MGEDGGDVESHGAAVVDGTGQVRAGVALDLGARRRVARRVVCRLQAGAQVAAGDRYGVMKFGSRMDVFVPVNAEIRVKTGESVRGGQTILAVLH